MRKIGQNVGPIQLCGLHLRLNLRLHIRLHLHKVHLRVCVHLRVHLQAMCMSGGWVRQFLVCPPRSLNPPTPSWMGVSQNITHFFDFLGGKCALTDRLSRQKL